MIIKIRRYKDGDPKRGGYWIIDNIDSVNVSEILFEGKSKINHDLYDRVFFDCPNIEDYGLLHCTKKDELGFNIAYDTFCYLLNDDGQTMDKIIIDYVGVNNSR